MKTYTFHVSGTHCASCKILIEDILNEQIGIQNTHVDLKSEIVSVETELDNSKHELAEMLNEKIKHNGYTLSVEKITKEDKNNGVIWQAIPIGLAFLVLFFILQKSGIWNLGMGAPATPETIFIIFLIPLFSICFVFVGGFFFPLGGTVPKD